MKMFDFYRTIECFTLSTAEESCSTCSNLFRWSVDSNSRTCVPSRTISWYSSSRTIIKWNRDEWSSCTGTKIDFWISICWVYDL